MDMAVYAEEIDGKQCRRVSRTKDGAPIRRYALRTEEMSMMTRPRKRVIAKASSRMSQRQAQLRAWIIWAAKYAVTVVLAHILIIGILVVLFESSYLWKSGGVVAASASLIIGRALWRNMPSR